MRGQSSEVRNPTPQSTQLARYVHVPPHFTMSEQEMTAVSSSALAGAATHHGPAVLYVACAPASSPTAASRHVASRRTAPRITHPAYVCVCSGEGWVVFGRQNGPTPARARSVHAPRTRARTLHSRATIRARLPTVALGALAYGGHRGPRPFGCLVSRVRQTMGFSYSDHLTMYRAPPSCATDPGV